MEIIERIRSALTTHGLKVTPQRIAVYRALLELGNHPDTDQIIAQVIKVHPTISPGTIYKTLDLFAEYGIIIRIKTDTGRMRFDHRTGPHHHLYDKTNDKIVDFDDDELNKLLSDFFKRKKPDNFEIEDVKLQIVGRFK